jgi:hypothetical protein
MQTAKANTHIYSLKVTLIEGPITFDFARSNPEVSRIIEISGGQTLRDLHEAIFRAFDRSSERGYEFQMEKGTHLPGNGCYLPVSECRDITGRPVEAKHADAADLDSLALSPGDSFCYWFDFTSAWMHRIVILSIQEAIPDKEYPHVAGKTGDSPPQCPDWDQVIRI